MTEHPPLFRLDAHAAGDHDAGVEAHLSGCTACADYVGRLRAAVQAHSDREGSKSADFVLALDDIRRERERERGRARASDDVPLAARYSRRWQITAAAGSVFAAAAVLLLIARPGSELARADAAVTEPSIRFKGKMQLAIIRDRRGEQTRSATEVRVRPGDRLRAEISVDDSRPVEVGFLGKDGTWVLLLAPALVEAGTYFSERAAEFDETPTEGWIIGGRPEAVLRARSQRSFDEVSTISVVAEP